MCFVYGGCGSVGISLGAVPVAEIACHVAQAEHHAHRLDVHSGTRRWPHQGRSMQAPGRYVCACVLLCNTYACVCV